MNVPEGWPTKEMQLAGAQAIRIETTPINKLWTANKVFKEMLEAAPTPPAPDEFQQRVQPWMMECFGQKIAADKAERNHRFLEEALELVQACACSQDEAHQLVDYVYGRPIGLIHQEVGGVMVTLAALCLAHGIDMHAAGEVELTRIWTKVEQIRTKQAAKPRHSPLPVAQPAQEVEPVAWRWHYATGGERDREWMEWGYRDTEPTGKGLVVEALYTHPADDPRLTAPPARQYESYCTNNVIMLREGDTPLFWQQGDQVICSLDGYAVTPLELVEQYDAPKDDGLRKVAEELNKFIHNGMHFDDDAYKTEMLRLVGNLDAELDKGKS